MPKVIVISDGQYEKICKDAVCIASNCQSDFEFNFIPQTELDNSPFDEPSAEVSDIIEF